MHEGLAEHAPCGLLATRPDGTVVEANATFLRWVGLGRDELLGRRLPDLLTPGGRVFYETHMGPMLRLQGSVRELALELECPQGALPVLLGAVADEEAGLVRVSVLDATERKQYEAELRRMRDRQALLARCSAELDEHATVRERAERLVAVLVDEGAAAVLLEVEGEGRRRSWVAGDPDRLTEGAPTRLPRVGQTGGRLVVTGLGDAALLAELAERVARSLEHARLAEHERSVAATLQRGLLAGPLPRSARLTLAPLHRPATVGLEVGGDWYDALEVGPERVLLVVGDVVGRGLVAATAMGQLRNAVRALALTGAPPGQVLTHLDAFVEHQPRARMATVVLAELDLATGDVRLASAGHPPPVLVHEDRADLVWGGRSAPLGAYLGATRRDDHELRLEPGDRLLLYTDGLVERRGERLESELRRLAEAFERHAPAGLAGATEATVAEMLVTGHTDDDVCALAAGYGVGMEYETSVAADPVNLSEFRADLRDWLAGNDVGGDDRDAVLLACGEAVANAIEHGYGADGTGLVDVRGRAWHDGVTIEVSDVGAWRPPPETTDRGRGLRIMRGLMDDVRVDRAGGTVVRMRRRRSAAA